MKKNILFRILMILVAILFFIAMTENDNLLNNNDMKKIVITYFEKNIKVEGKEIIFSYYDEVTKLPIVRKEKTNSEGNIIIFIPCSNNGASSIFSFAMSEKEIKKVRAFRIPPSDVNGGQDSISINLYKGKKCFFQNDWASIQWVNFPADGSNINIVQSNIYILKYNESTQEATDIKRMSFVNGQYKQVGVEDVFLEGSRLNILN